MLYLFWIILWIPLKVGAVEGAALQRIVSDFAGCISTFFAFKGIVVRVSDLARLAAEWITAVTGSK